MKLARPLEENLHCVNSRKLREQLFRSLNLFRAVSTPSAFPPRLASVPERGPNQGRGRPLVRSSPPIIRTIFKTKTEKPHTITVVGHSKEAYYYYGFQGPTNRSLKSMRGGFNWTSGTNGIPVLRVSVSSSPLNREC